MQSDQWDKTSGYPDMEAHRPLMAPFEDNPTVTSWLFQIVVQSFAFYFGGSQIASKKFEVAFGISVE